MVCELFGKMELDTIEAQIDTIEAQMTVSGEPNCCRTAPKYK